MFYAPCDKVRRTNIKPKLLYNGFVDSGIRRLDLDNKAK